MALFVSISLVAVGLVIPVILGWRGSGWRVFAALVLVWGALSALAGLALHRADEACLATPGCQGQSGIAWVLLGAAGVGYPVVTGVLLGLGAWARRLVRRS